MSLFPRRADGYYDDQGQWQKTKHCFVDCRERCTCRPPSGKQYSEAHDKRNTKTIPPSEESPS